MGPTKYSAALLKRTDKATTGLDPAERNRFLKDGERALGLFPGNKEMKPPSGVAHYKLFWTYRSDYWEITGEYLEDVLALEKRLKEQGTNAVWGWR